MARQNRSISFPEDVSTAIDEAAAAEDLTPSAWITEAVRHRLRIERGIVEMDEWLKENGGPMTDEERADTAAFLTRASSPAHQAVG
jgi:predicted transcriptional regulator